MEPVLLRVQEAATLLKVSKWTIYRWIEEGRLRATKIGPGSVRVHRSSAIGLIAETPSDRPNAQRHLPSKSTRARATRQKSKE